MKKYLIEADYGYIDEYYLRDVADTEEEAMAKVEIIQKDWPLEIGTRISCAVLPDKEDDLFDFARNLLEKEGVCIDDEGHLSIHIPWGDWKHSHLKSDRVMNLFGFTLVTETVTEEDGSDCYSAWHRYKSERR